MAGRVGNDLERAHSLLAAGDVRKSAEVAQMLVRKDPQNPHVWHLLSGIYGKVGQLSEASACAERAVALAPTELTFLIQYGQCLVNSGRRREALAVADRATLMDVHRADWNDALGTLLTFCEEPARALPFFQGAVDRAPQNGSFRYNLATAQRMTGEMGTAESTLDRVLADRPNDYLAYYTRASLRVQSPGANHIEEMLRVLQSRSHTPSQEVALCFALAKELEDVGRYRTSFGYLKRASDIQRKQIHYNVVDDIMLMDQIIELHDHVAVSAVGGAESDECIFVIGLPRSGTTLVERILGSHSDVTAAGELQAFPNQIVKGLKKHSGGVTKPEEFARRTLGLDPGWLGRSYIEATRPQTGKTPRFIDKLPLNYLNAGLIRRALPRARIVALARDPMDSCYAMYKTLFPAAYPFSYSLLELAEYYAAWHRLMRHWQEVLGEALLIVQYENLVTHQESVSRRIVAHCGLAWEGACLAFHEHKGAVTTASAAQVRQAMYSSSIGKWHHVESELEPLIQSLHKHEPLSGWRLSHEG